VVKEGSPRGEGTIGLTKSQCRINPRIRLDNDDDDDDDNRKLPSMKCNTTPCYEHIREVEVSTQPVFDLGPVWK
jgi:hypothetical protein